MKSVQSGTTVYQNWFRIKKEKSMVTNDFNQKGAWRKKAAIFFAMPYFFQNLII